MKTIKQTIQLLLPLLCAGALNAQPGGKQLYGHVGDNAGKLSLQHASVVLKSTTDSVFVIQTVSDAKGNFQLTDLRSDVYVLTVQYVGYTSFISGKISLDSTSNTPQQLDVSLQRQPNGLQAVVVTAAAARPFIEQKIDKIVLNIAASPVAAGGTAYDALLRAPGITEENESLKFRKRSVTVLINGRPSNLNGDDLKNMLTAMPASQIEKIEVLPNPSAKYDAQGGSIINIILAKNMNYGINGVLTSGIGTGRFVKYNEGLSLNYREKSLNVYGSYDYQHNGQYFDNHSDRVLAENAHIVQNEYDVRRRNNQSYKLGADYDIDKNNSIGILFRGFRNARNRTVNNRSDVAYTGAPADSSSTVLTNGYARFENAYVNGYYKSKLDTNGTELTLNADYFRYNKTWHDNFITSYFDENGKPYQDPYLLKDNSPALNTVKSFSADYVRPTAIGNFEAGIKTTFTTIDNNVLWQMQDSLVNWKTDAGKTNHFVYKENINAGYINYSKKINRIDLQAGLRAEQTNTTGESVTLKQVDKRNYLNFFPNIGLQFTQSDNSQFGLSYRKSISRASFEILNPFLIYQSQYAYMQGNPAMRPEIDHTIDFSHVFKNELFSDISYTRAVNSIASVFKQSDNNAVITTYDNFSHADIYSATLSYVKPLVKNLWTTETTLGAFYAKYAAGDANTRLPDPKVTGYVSSNNTFTLPAAVTMELSGYYYSAVSSASMQTRPQYSASIGFAKKILHSKGSLKLNVTDLFNTQVTRYRALYGPVNMDVHNKMESRFVNLVFSYRFGNKNVKAAKSRESGIEDVKGRIGTN